MTDGVTGEDGLDGDRSGCRRLARRGGRLARTLQIPFLLLALLVSPPLLADACCRLSFESFTALPDAGTPRDVASSPDGRYLYQALPDAVRVLSVNARNGTLRVVDTLSALPATLDLAALALEPWRLLVSPDGVHLYVSHRFGTAVFQRDARSGRLAFLQRLPGNGTAHHLVFDARGLHLYAGVGGDVAVFRRNRRTGELQLLEVEQGPPGLKTRGPLTLSPDGRNLYLGAVQSGDDDGIVIFDREPLTGLLDGQRALLAGADGVQGLTNPQALVFDASGNDLYVASRQPALSHYRRDPATGDLSFVQILTAGEDLTPPRLSDSKDLAMLPGGAALALLDASGVHLFARELRDGSLRFVESQREGIAGVGNAIGEGSHRLLAAPGNGDRLFVAASDGVGSMRDSGVSTAPRILHSAARIADGDAAAASGVVEGLVNASASALSPDGRFLYVAADGIGSADHSTLAVFSIDPSSGDYRQVAFLDGDDLGLPDIRSIAVSGDGRHLYALADDRTPGAGDTGRLSVFVRDRTGGGLTLLQTLEQGGSDGAGGIVDGLLGPREVRLSGDGNSVYVVGAFIVGDPLEGDGTVAVFRRNRSSGLLGFVQAVDDQFDVPGGIKITNARDLAVTPNGRHVYVAAGGRHSFSHSTTHALTHFRRSADGSLSHVASVADPGITRADFLQVSPDGRHLYAVERTGFSDLRLSVFSLHPRSGEPTRVSAQRDGFAGLRSVTVPTGLGISRDGRHVVLSGPAGVALLERDRRSGVLKVLDSADGERIATASIRFINLDPASLAVHAVDQTGRLMTIEPRPGPVLTVPSEAEALSGSDVRFSWTFYAGRASGVRLKIGTTPGAEDVFARNFPASSRAARVRGLPLDGNPLHVTLSAGDLPAYEATFTAAMPPPPALLAPADGARLAPGRVTFRWDDNGQAVTRWGLRVGSSPGGDDLYSRDFAARSRSVSVANLPADGRELFVTLLATVDGVIQESASVVLAALPAPRLSLAGASGDGPGGGTTFAWTGSDLDDGYRLIVGSVPGADDLCDSGDLAAGGLGFTCTGLPLDGRELFATLLRSSGDATTRHELVVAPALPQPGLAAPEDGSTLAGHTVTFRLQRRSRPVTAWDLRVGTRRGASDLFRAVLPGDAVEVAVPGLPTLGGEVFARLYYTVDGRRRFEDLRFDAADLPLPSLTVPSNFTRVSAEPIEFRWSDRGHHLSYWRVDIGTAPGAGDIRSISSDDDSGATTTVHGSGAGNTELQVPGVLADTRVYVRWTYRIGASRTERFEARALQPDASVCCDIVQGTPLVDDSGGVDGLLGANAVAVSPDGLHVYASGAEKALVVLARDADPVSPTFGALSFLERVPGPSIGAIVISADGSRVYSSDWTDVSVYARSAASGGLTLLQTLPVDGARGIALAPDPLDESHLYAVQGSDLVVLAISPVDGTLSVALTARNGAGGVTAMGDARRVSAIHAGDEFVDLYVSSTVDDALLVFRHDRSKETLTLTEQIVNGVDGVNGLARVVGLASDGAGEFVYAHGADGNQGGLAVFARDASSGALTYRPAFNFPASILSGQSNFSSLAVGADGERFYALARSSGGESLQVFERDPVSGELGGIVAAGTPQILETEMESTAGALAFATSPDGLHLYLAREGGLFDLDGGVSAYRVNPDNVAPDALTFIDVVKDGDGGVDGLRNVADLALSPDGRHLYGVSAQESKLVAIARDPGTDDLEFVQLLRQDAPGLGALAEPRAVVVSPDGAFVYVASRSPTTPGIGHGIMIFTRDAASGELSFLARHVPPEVFTSQQVYLAMSADGAHIYVMARTERRIAVLARDPMTGLLSEVSRYQASGGSSGELANPEKIVVSGDGRNVYVANYQFSSIAMFRRDAVSGGLSLLGVVRNDEDGVSGMLFPVDLAMSRDGRDVYVTAGGLSNVVHFSRRPADGLLQFRGATRVAPEGGVSSLTGLAFDPASDLLFVLSRNGMATFTRAAATGELIAGPIVGGVRANVYETGRAGDPLFVAYSDVTAATESVQTVSFLQPVLLSPAPDATLAAQTTRFEWDANGVAAPTWRLRVGERPGAGGYCDSGPLPPASRAFTCTGLPRDGEPLFATLVAGAGDDSPAVTVSYTAADLALPVLASPVPGTAVAGSQVFTLDTGGNDIERWFVRAGTTLGGRNLLDARLGGDVTEFTIDGLPADADVFVSVEVRGSFGRSTTVYQYNASPAVIPVYPVHGADWGDYVRAGTDGLGDGLGGADRACAARTRGERSACLHGGEHRLFVVPGVLSCDGVSAVDAIGAFDWTCSDAIMPVRVLSTGLKRGRRLSDLLVFAPPDFLLNRVTVTHGGSTESAATRWWDNPVENADQGGRLLDAGTVYVTSEAQPQEPFLIQQRSGVALVVNPAATLGQAVVAGESLIHLDRADFAWIEGRLDATGAGFGVSVDRSAWAVLDGVSVTGADTPASDDFAAVSSAGIAAQRSRNLLLRGVDTAATGGAGVALYRTTGSEVADLRASDAVTGVLLARASNNRLQRLALGGHLADGLALEDRSIDNVLVEVTSTNNMGDGVVVAGRSDGNRLIQVLTRHNAGSGVLLDGSIGNLLLGATSLDNAGDGVALSAVSRSVLAALALGNNGDDGLNLAGARDNLVMDVASVHNGGAGVALSAASIRNGFRGDLRVGDNGASDCVVEAGSSELTASCTALPGSGLNRVSGVTLAGAFVGAVSADDPVNLLDVDGEVLFADLLDPPDWFDFATRWRSWGRSGTLADAFSRGTCAAGETCRAWDARLRADDTGAGGLPALAGVLPLAGIADQVAFRLRARERFLPYARELLFDGAGDDDGLCEAGEDCLAMPNLGAFQGEGALQPAGELPDGTALFRYPIPGL